MKFSLMAIVLVTLCSNFCSAQQQHFIYIQSDDRQPFYVKLDSKLISSTSSGYAIIPKVSKSDVDIQIGFPKNEFPLQKLALNVTGDVGYNLKNFGSGKWGLFNLQTMQIVYAGDKKEENVIATSSPISIKDINTKSPVEDPEEMKKASVTGTNVITSDSKLTEPISKTNEENSEKMYSAVYKVEGVNSTEYINISIAKTTMNQKEEAISETKKVPVKDADAVKETKVVKEDEERFLDIELQNPNTKSDSIVPENSKQATNSQMIKNDNQQKLSFNSDCKLQATEEDFFELRKSMAAKRTDEEMREVAMKFFKKKCFTTQQIRGLANILLVEENRLLFYGSAYAFTSDPQNYGTLKADLSTSELKERFDNLIR